MPRLRLFMRARVAAGGLPDLQGQKGALRTVHLTGIESMYIADGIVPLGVSLAGVILILGLNALFYRWKKGRQERR